MAGTRPPPSGTPLVDALLRNASAGRVSFHMPGHSDGRAFPDGFASALASFDTTELPWTDDLNHPAGPAREAMDLAAAAFGAGWTRFATCGATCALLAAVAALCPRGSRVLVLRPCHRSVAAAVALLGLDPAFPAPGPARPPSPLARADAAAVAAALAADPTIRTVIATSPDYYGAVSDLAALAAAAHARGASLLVDEAHGAHFAFVAGAPPTALACGADVVVHSAHKTLPALTQAALLHVSRDALATGRVEAGRVEEALRTFHTSSPSFPIAASIDAARAALEREAKHGDGFARRIRAVSALRRRLGDAAAAEASDPLRIVVDVRDLGLAGFEAARRLAERGIAVEMGDPGRIVLLPGLFADATPGGEGFADLDAFERAYAEMARVVRSESSSGPASVRRPRSPVWPLPPEAFGALLSAPAERVLPPSAAVDARMRGVTDAVPLADAVGRAVAVPLVPYPPGIALVWPGERLDAARAALLAALEAQGATVSGIDHGRIACLPAPPEALL